MNTHIKYDKALVAKEIVRLYNTGGKYTYDKAGNLTECAKGYTYEYDYENRITKVKKSGTDIAEYTYDALNRRIEKKDCIDANYTQRYYYSDKWQVLAEYDVNNNLKNSYFYGNYIDEVLTMNGLYFYYVHDHLYSPVALYHLSGVVAERYEYDAYGGVTIWDANLTTERETSIYGNPYYFTGRRMDVLDSNDYQIMYYRNRYYDVEDGRFLTNDPLGITPNSEKPNLFNVRIQYGSGLNLYQYVQSSPVIFVDSFGLMWVPPLPPPKPGPTPKQKCDDWITEELKDTTWLSKIPKCPCKICKSGSKWCRPDKKKWTALEKASEEFHYGAEVCMRSKGNKGGPGQQCCYDSKGNIITRGRGAGTPDKVSPEGPIDAMRHYRSDVKMFKYCIKHLGTGWVTEYHKVRPPNDCL